MYDLHIGDVGAQQNAADGCQVDDDSCRVSTVHEHGDCGVNALCTGSYHGDSTCQCKPGWRGPRCDIRES